ncbi:hypothetical protein GNQ08_27100 [Paenibacillus macerans]|uniref:Uncharacterized protein n=1 Tax=Paenibacillus macerans TaxID=44252 RepID=A0A6N8F5G6_PAEMA|nr:hypothetical protein [Paenibacillus macerans]MDU5945484.1 hypothetical protein [Paenibacillus macerans]MUG26033.1 hypothetical protein [Paenibacillus macerans]
MEAIVNKPLKHFFMDVYLDPGTEIEVEEEETELGNVQIIAPEEYAEMYIPLSCIDLVKGVNTHE